MNPEELKKRSVYYVFFYSEAKGDQMAKQGMVGFDDLNTLYGFYSTLQADHKFMLRNIAVNVNVSEAIIGKSGPIEVVHGAPDIERTSQEPEPQVPGGPVVGTKEAVEVTNDQKPTS